MLLNFYFLDGHRGVVLPVLIRTQKSSTLPYQGVLRYEGNLVSCPLFYITTIELIKKFKKKKEVSELKMKKKILVIFCFVLSSQSVLGQYIDPGTGVAIAGSLWPLIISFFAAIGAFLVKYFWNPIKKKCCKLFNKRRKE